MNRFVWEDGEIGLITNEYLTCRDCIYKSRYTATCVAYEDGKPLEVIEKGNCKFKRTASKKLNSDDDDEKWITTESGHKVCLNSEGEVVKGNKYAMGQTEEQQKSPPTETPTEKPGNLSPESAEKSTETVENSGEGSIMNNKVISGALNSESKAAKQHAKQYYKSVAKMTTDVSSISQNTGYSKEQIEYVKRFIFTEEHDLGDRIGHFVPDYDMAQSWQRLIEGKNIQHHDLTLIEHELYERDLMLSGKTQDEAHKMASRKFNYAKEAHAYYDKVKKNREK